jgi:1,4-dihydroxy-2-naphthoyl-CoA hydrolase
VSIWFRRPTPELIEPLQRNTLAEHLGIDITEIGDDFLRGTMQIAPRVHQPMGILHGGASVVMAETLASVAANFCIDTSKFSCVGQEINANHVRSIASGTVTGTTRPFHIGARSQVWGIEIRDEQDRLICVSRITMATVSRPMMPRV